MDDQSIPIIGEDLDLAKIPPLNQQRSVSFLNHFILRTTNFLNKFSNMAESELMTQSLDIQNIETALNLLEAKLDSIPGLQDITATSAPKTVEPSGAEITTQKQSTDSTAPATSADTEEPTAEEAPPANFITVKQDPRYAKFLKMVTVGVPKGAVETKMRLEGLNPDLLDTPNAPVPDAVAQDSESDNESASLSSGDDDFSD